VIDDIRPIARIIHLLFSLTASLVVFWLMGSIYSDKPTVSKWHFLLVASFWALSAGVLVHATLDWLVGVP
jgi:hypothetical protein